MEGLFTPDIKYIKGLLPERDENGNKGTFGRALIISGSRNMCGCAVLAATGALRSGAGLVELAFPDVLYTPILSQLKECVFLPLETARNGTISRREGETVFSKARESDVVLFGCGVGVSDGTTEIARLLLTCQSTPLIIDADGINILSRNPELLKKRTAPVLITPHPGEMARLTGRSVSEIEKNRESVVRAFSGEYGITVLLKGHRTLICENGGRIFCNTVGNSGLSKGGAGDLLSGIIAGLAASGKNSLFESAVLGAYLHGLTSEILKERLGEYSMLPSDCANALPEAFKAVLGAK